MLKTNKEPATLTFEYVLGQLRHAYALMTADVQAWAPEQRKRFAEGLVGPAIEQLEQLAKDFDQQGDDLTAACTTVVRQRHELRAIEEDLLKHAHDIASASQARRIIVSAFHQGQR